MQARCHGASTAPIAVATLAGQRAMDADDGVAYSNADYYGYDDIL